MKFNLDTLKNLIGFQISNSQLLKKLNCIGFESLIDNNYITIFIPYNRQDCCSYLGILKELRIILTNSEFTLKKEYEIVNDVKIDIYSKNFCYNYMYIIIKNIDNKTDTPKYIKNDLEKNKINKNSFIIDILNYSTLITGQPLHAYDLNLIDKHIKLKKTNNSKIITTFNGKNIYIKKNTHVIVSKNNIISIPGIIGCKDYEINKNTSSILMECAYFNPNLLLTESKNNKIETKSSKIFSKHINLDNQLYSMIFTINLLNKYNCNMIYSVIKKKSKKNIKRYKIIKLKLLNIKKLIGINISEKFIEKTLNNINFKYLKFKNTWKVYIPIYRNDIKIEENIINEIIKEIGFNKIPSIFPIKCVYNKKYNNKKKSLICKIKEFLINRGYIEVINYSFVDYVLEKLLCEHDNFIYIKNPISKHMNVMRFKLLQGLLKNVSFNMSRKNLYLKLFEIGNIYFYSKNMEPVEKLYIAGICTEKEVPEYINIMKYNNLFTIKHIFEKICCEFYNITCLNYVKSKIKYFFNNTNIKIMANNEEIGNLGEINKEILDKFNIKNKLFYFEICSSKQKIKKTFCFEVISKFPFIEVDISILINKGIYYNDIIVYIKELNILNLKKIKLLYIYENKNLYNEKLSMTLKLIFQSNNETLIYKKVDSEILNLLKNLKFKFKISSNKKFTIC